MSSGRRMSDVTASRPSTRVASCASRISKGLPPLYVIANRRKLGHNFSQQFNTLAGGIGLLQRQAGGVAAGSCQGLNHARANWVCHRCENDRNGGGRLLDRDAWWGCRRDDHIHFQADQLGRSLSEALVASLRPPILDGDCAALNPTEIA